MFCKNCGAKVPENADFCPECGKVLPHLQSTDQNQPADSPDTGTSTKKKGGKTKFIIGAAVVIVAIALVIVASQKQPIEDMKNIVFEDYGSITFGEAVEENIRNVEWESEEIDSTHYVVTMVGFIPETYSNVELSFDLNYVDDMVYTSAKEVIIDGEYYEDNYTISLVMDSVYGN